MSAEFDGMRADYEAAKRSSRFQRRRRGVPTMGAGADYHYASESDYLWMQEAARDIYRNDVVVGQITDRAVVNTIGIVFVAAIAARIATSGAPAQITATLRLTRSAAMSGSRSNWPSAQRYSMARLRPSVKPSSLRPR